MFNTFFLIFKINRYFLAGKQFTNSAELKKIEWETLTGVLGEEIIGIWEKYTDKTDVNAADVNFKEKCIVTGDGKLSLIYFS